MRHRLSLSWALLLFLGLLSVVPRRQSRGNGMDTLLLFACAEEKESPSSSSIFSPVGDDAFIAAPTNNSSPAISTVESLTPAQLLPTSCSISGVAFFDSNDDGIYDVTTSTGIYNTSVGLFNCTGDIIINTTKTDTSGYYSFDGLPGGQYYVSSTPQPWYAFSDVWSGKIDLTPGESMHQNVDSAIDPETGSTDCFDLKEGEDKTISFGLKLGVWSGPARSPLSNATEATSSSVFSTGDWPKRVQSSELSSSSISGFAFFDSNSDGIYDSSTSARIYDTSVSLFNCTGDIINTTKTDTSGYYSFDGLPGGQYYVSSTPQPWYAFSDVWSGKIENVDSAINPKTGNTGCFDLKEGGNNTVHFGLLLSMVGVWSNKGQTSNPQSNASFNASSTSQLPSPYVPHSVSNELSPSNISTTHGPSHNSTSNFSSSEMPSASPSSRSGGLCDITTRERLTITIRGIELLEDEELWSVVTSNYIMVYFNSTSDDPGVFDVTVSIEVMFQWNNNDARLNRPDDRQLQAYGESKTFVEVTFLAVMNYNTFNPEEYDGVYLTTAPFSSQQDMKVYTSTLLGISPYYGDNVLSVAMGRMGLASPGMHLNESIAESGDAQVDEVKNPRETHGPATTTKQLMMTIYGIEMLEDEEAWSVATSNYIIAYFNLTNDHRGAYNVTASIEVIDQTSGNDTSFQHPQGWHVKVVYELTSSHRTSNAVRYDDIYVATAPFFSRTASEGYIEALHSLSPYYNDTRFILVDTPPVMSIVLSPIYPDDNKESADTKIVIIVGAICGATILVVISVGLVLFIKKSRKDELSESTTGSSIQPADNDLENAILSNLESEIANDSVPPSILHIDSEAHSERNSTLQVRFSYGSRFSTLSQSGQSSNPNSSIPSIPLVGTNSVPDQKDSRQLNSSSEPDHSSFQKSGSSRSNASSLCDIPEIKSVDTLKIAIIAPGGKLGIVTETPLNGGPAFVCDILNTCSIIGLIRLGDKIIAVDDKDVRDLSGAALSKLLGSKKYQSQRKITILREIDAIKKEGEGSVGGEASSMVSHDSSPIPSANTSTKNVLQLPGAVSSSSKVDDNSILSESAPNGVKEETTEFSTYDNSSPVNKTPSIRVDDKVEIIAPPGWMGIVLDDPKPPALPGPAYASRVLEISPLVGKLHVGDKIILVDGDDVQEMTARNVTRLLTTKGMNPERKITISRDVGSGGHGDDAMHKVDDE